MKDIEGAEKRCQKAVFTRSRAVCYTMIATHPRRRKRFQASGTDSPAVTTTLARLAQRLSTRPRTRTSQSLSIEGRLHKLARPVRVNRAAHVNLPLVKPEHTFRAPSGSTLGSAGHFSITS